MSGGRIRLALVGCGGMGRRWASAVQRTTGAALVFAVDEDLTRAKFVSGQFRDCKTAKDWRKVVRVKDVDGVLVATPHKFLAQISFTALKNGKHVLCEKPGGINPGDVRKAYKMANLKRLCYMMGFNYRFFDSVLKTRKILESGKIGEIILIRAHHGFGGRKDYRREWRHNKKLSGGGELIDQGVHLIDLARFFLGEIKRIKGFTQDGFWHSGVEDNAFILLQNQKGKIASLHVSWTQWNPAFSFEIYGTKGYLRIEGLGRKYGGTEKIFLGIRDSDFKKLPGEKIIICNPEADLALIKELREFIKAIKKKRNPIPNGKDGYKVLEIVKKIYAQ